MNKENMILALQDVRTAYRLLADYQQKVIELIDFIKNELGAEHYYHYRPNNVDSRAIHKIYTDPKSGCAFLSMMDLHLLWHRTKHIPDGEEWQNNIQKDDLVFDILIASDENDGGKLSPAQSRSELQIYVYQAIQYQRKINWYDDIWIKSVYPEFGEVGQIQNDTGEYCIYADKLDLTDLYDEQVTRTALVAFRQRASEKLQQTI